MCDCDCSSKRKRNLEIAKKGLGDREDIHPDMTLAEVLQDKVQLLRETFCLSASTERHQISRENVASRHGGIPLSTKLCYAVGGIPYQATNIAMAFSFQIFLLDVVQMEASFVSLILFVSRAWDAITDPLVGYLVSRSRWTATGKLLPWSFLSVPLGIISYMLLWFVPHTNSSITLPWYLIISCLFETLMSCYHVPYTSLNMFLGGSQSDRDSATAYRMSAEVLSMLLAALIQGQVLRVYNRERQDSCLEQNESDDDDDLTHSTPSPSITPLQDTREAFLTSALILGALFFLCGLVLFLGVKERKGSSGFQTHRGTSYLVSLKKLIGHISYQRLVLGFLFSSLAFQMSFGNFALFCIHVAGMGAQFQYFMLTILVTATISVPLWQVALVRLGKKWTLFLGLPLVIPALIVLVFVSGSFSAYMAMCVLIGASVATLFLLPWSMLPDVVDEFAVQNPCCRDLEPLFFSCSCFCNKLGGGLSAAISTMTLHFTGYKTGACHHSKGVIMALKLLLAPIPIALLLVGLGFFCLYPINEKRRKQIQLELEQRRVKAVNLDEEEDTRHRGSKKSSSFGEHFSTASSARNHSAFSLECNSEPPFYKPRCSSKISLPIFTIGTDPFSLKEETCSKKAKVTWV